MKDMISLTLEQQQLVEHYLSVVNWVIIDHIKLNPQVCGLGYSDVYQEGCVHLCRAAATCQGDPAGLARMRARLSKRPAELLQVALPRECAAAASHGTGGCSCAGL